MKQTRPATLEEWYTALTRAWKAPGQVATTECPNCAQTQLVFGYIRYPGASGSNVLFYCSACLVGVPPDPGRPPEGMEPVPVDSLEIPNFRMALGREFM